MADVAALVRELIEAGTPPDVAASIVARAFVAGAQEAPQSTGPWTLPTDNRSASAIRQARYRERHKASQSVTSVTEVTKSVTDVTNNVTRYTPSPKDVEVIFLPPETNQNPSPLQSPLAAPNGAKQRLRQAPSYPADFELLWREFPRHPNASKAEALKSWSLLPDEDRDKCLDGAMAYTRFLDGERRKRPDYPALHLATFVNQRRWESLLEQRH